MKRLLFVGLLLVALSFVVGGATPFVGAHTVSAAGSHNYNVLVGVDDPGQGISIGAFYPATLHVHVGDHVNWMQNTHEIHTVTFLAGGARPANDLACTSAQSYQLPVDAQPGGCLPDRTGQWAI